MSDLLYLRDALARLGCGRTWLLAHLRKHPTHAGRPTHRIVGRAIRFTAADLDNLLETMAPCPSSSNAAAKSGTSPAPSPGAAFALALWFVNRRNDR